jgi:hypothetical protein
MAFMAVRSRLVTVVAICAWCAAASASASEKYLYRIFLQDGTTLVSYGEYARVDNRVVFSIPVGAIETSPQLQLVSIADSVVDWTRTEEYAEAVRARRYAETRGEEDFAALSNHVARALNEVVHTKDPAQRLAMALEARGNLADWPKRNYGYRANDVTQLVWLFDDVITQLRTAAGQPGVEVSLYATTAPPPLPELLPVPDAQASIEGALAAARLAEQGERVSLLQAIAAALRPDAARGSWEATLLERASAELAVELRTTTLYADLTRRMAAVAAARARSADVRGLERLIGQVRAEDERLGRLRPREMAALLAALDLNLDEARRLRLARDAWALRGQLLRRYRHSIEPAIAQLSRSAAWLEDIRSLAGPAPRLLAVLERRMADASRTLAVVSTPAEAQAAHTLLAGAARMAARAAQSRRNAIESNGMAVAWEASSAAAGALLMFERALDDVNRLTSPPSPR